MTYSHLVSLYQRSSQFSIQVSLENIEIPEIPISVPSIKYSSMNWQSPLGEIVLCLVVIIQAVGMEFLAMDMLSVQPVIIKGGPDI